MADEKTEQTGANPPKAATDTGAQMTQAKPGDTKVTATVGQDAAAGKTPPAAPQGSLWDMMPMLVGMILIFYFLMIRPENKRRQQQQLLLSAIKKNDRVVLQGIGIHGTVADIEGDDVTLVIDPKKDVRIKVRKEAIGTILNQDEKK